MATSRNWPLILSVVLLAAAIVAFAVVGDRMIPLLVLTGLNVAFRLVTRKMR